MFAASINLQVYPERNEYKIVNSGHMPLIHFERSRGELAKVKPSGLPLVIGSEYKCQSITGRFQPGDRLMVLKTALKLARKTRFEKTFYHGMPVPEEIRYSCS